jgi:hypothetical protein
LGTGGSSESKYLIAGELNFKSRYIQVLKWHQKLVCAGYSQNSETHHIYLIFRREEEIKKKEKERKLYKERKRKK